MIVVDPKSKPCPGVERAISMAEEVLRKGDILFSIGQLIHNRREVERLQKLGLQNVDNNSLLKTIEKNKLKKASFLVRTHGELEGILKQIKEKNLPIVDATCPIVRHSQELIDQHVREGWGIIIIGNKDHPEVVGLKERTNGYGIVISTIDEIDTIDFEGRSLLLGQTTVDPVFFSEAIKILSTRLSNLKVVDTTCRFINKRQKDVADFCSNHDVTIFIGGKNSSNGKLLYKTALKHNPNTYFVEEPGDVDRRWFKKKYRVGVFGGASTPSWQLEELRSYLDNHHTDKNPKGFKNNKGGIFKWWKLKKQN